MIIYDLPRFLPYLGGFCGQLMSTRSPTVIISDSISSRSRAVRLRYVCSWSTVTSSSRSESDVQIDSVSAVVVEWCREWPLSLLCPELDVTVVPDFSLVVTESCKFRINSRSLIGLGFECTPLWLCFALDLWVTLFTCSYSNGFLGNGLVYTLCASLYEDVLCTVFLSETAGAADLGLFILSPPPSTSTCCMNLWLPWLPLPLTTGWFPLRSPSCEYGWWFTLMSLSPLGVVWEGVRNRPGGADMHRKSSSVVDMPTDLWNVTSYTFFICLFVS